MHRIARQIYHAILRANHIMLIPHPNPDGDALGSVAAFMEYLRSINKPHTAFCTTSVSPRLAFLPHTDYVTHDPAVWESSAADLVIVFDSGDLRYAGIAEHIEKRHPVVVNFDHHATNEFFGDYNMVMQGASSTTEVLYYFFRYNNVPLSSAMATCLLTGLITDTDNFTNAATTTKSLAIASDLIARGGDAQRIKGWVFKDKSINTLKLWGTVLSRLTRDETTDLVHTYLTQEDLQKYMVSETEAEGIANFMNTLRDGSAALILKEGKDGTVKGSFRTTRDTVDVSLWAKTLGGGGHKKAAGFTIPGPVDAALKKILDTIRANTPTMYK